MLREETERVGALLLFDEVMTGFRVAKGGYQSLCDIRPDLTTLGKIIGGGFPVGAYGGRREIMEMVSPAGPVYQAGTLSGNPIAMTAGLATLNALNDESYAQLEARGAQLEAGIRDALKQHKIEAQLQRQSSMWTLFFNADPVTSYAEAKVQRFDDVWPLLPRDVRARRLSAARTIRGRVHQPVPRRSRNRRDY